MTEEEATKIRHIVKDVYDERMSEDDAIEYIKAETRQSRRSASMIVYVFNKMKQGKVYTREMNLILTEYFLAQIFADDGVIGLKMALEALLEHIQTLEKNGKNRPGLRRTHAKFSDKLPK